MSRRQLPPPRTTGAADVLRSRYRADDPADEETEAPAASPATAGIFEATPSRAFDATPSRRRQATTSQPREPTQPRPQSVTASRRRDVTIAERPSRPSAGAETTVSFTVRFDGDENDAHLRLLMALKRAGRLKRLPDKSEVIRAALRLIEEDPELQRRILDRL